MSFISLLKKGNIKLEMLTYVREEGFVEREEGFV